MRTLTFRLVSSAVLVSFVLATLFVFPLWIFVFVIGLFVSVALFEFYTMVRQRGVLVHRPLGVILGIIFTGLVAWRSLVEPGLVPVPVVGPGASALSWLWDIFWPATIAIIFIRQLTRESNFEALSGLANTLFGLVYIAYLFNFLIYIRALHPQQGAWLVCFLILVTKMSDAGAYGFGKLWGRTTLMVRISPNKTYEGLVGAIVIGGVSAALARSMLGFTISVPLSVGLGCLLGLTGQLGDLAESLIKRDCQVKDTSTFVPGIGGVLDVLDSLLFTAPLFYGILIYG